MLRRLFRGEKVLTGFGGSRYHELRYLLEEMWAA